MDKQQNPTKKPTSAPAVPKELLSARPAMTKIRPKMPDPVEGAAKAVNAPQPTAEEIEERQARIDYLRGLREKDKKAGKGGKKWLIVLLVLFVLALLGGAAAYILLKKPAPATTATTTNQSNVNQPADNSPAASAQQADMKTYDSTNFALSFKYPADWTISDTTAGLTAASPKFTLTTADGSKKPVGVVLHIRPQQAAIPEFKAGNATAVLDSKNVTYTTPAPGQRGSTYLSYLQYATTTTKGALDSIYITGNAGYQKGQNVPQADVVKVNPLINVSFVDCSSTCTPTSQAASVSATYWAAGSQSQTVETMLRSLSIN